MGIYRVVEGLCSSIPISLLRQSILLLYVILTPNTSVTRIDESVSRQRTRAHYEMCDAADRYPSTWFVAVVVLVDAVVFVAVAATLLRRSCNQRL